MSACDIILFRTAPSVVRRLGEIRLRHHQRRGATLMRTYGRIVRRLLISDELQLGAHHLNGSRTCRRRHGMRVVLEFQFYESERASNLPGPGHGRDGHSVDERAVHEPAFVLHQLQRDAG